jgi:hypothetical protein
MKKIGLALVFPVFAAAAAMGASLKIVSPNGGETLVIGAPAAIQWSATGISEKVRLILFKGGKKFGIIADGLNASPSSYSWTAGQYSGGTAAAGTDYQVRIRTLSDSHNDLSNNFFALQAPSSPPGLQFDPEHLKLKRIDPKNLGALSAKIAITSPAAGGQYTAGQPLPVAWNKNIGFTADLHLYLLDDQGEELQHVFPVANTGQYNGLVPGMQYTWPGRKFQVELAAVNPNTQSVLQGASGFFSILAPPPQQPVVRTLARNGETETTHTRQYQDQGMPECLSASHPAPGRQPGSREIKVGHHVRSGRHGECDWYEAYYFHGHVNFDLDEVKGKQVLEAKLLVSLSGFQQLNPQGDLATNEECDSNCDVYIKGAGYSEGKLASFSIFSEGEKQSLDVTKAVQYWAAGNANDGLLFSAKLSQSKYANSVCLKYYSTMFLTVRYVD